MKTKWFILVWPAIFIILTAGCKTSKSTVSPKPSSEQTKPGPSKNAVVYEDPYSGKSDDELNATEKYIKKYRDLAISEMKKSKIPASITLAQGILESANGNSYLATKANNHFGIKCGKDWKGESIYFDDDQANECFRKYKSVEESYIDHSSYLKNNARYASLFQLDIYDYKAWAKGLKEAGYATRRNYAELLIDLIEKNKLYIYDKTIQKNPDVEPKPVADQQFKYNGIPAIQVKQGDTYALIAKRNGISLARLLEYNDLKEQIPLKEGEIVYLGPKKPIAKESYHIVRKTDRMYTISQEYGIKLASLYEKNLMKPGEEPAVGEILYLRQKRTEPAETRVIKPEEQPVAEQTPVAVEEKKPESIQKPDSKEGEFEEVPVQFEENQMKKTEEPVEIITPETKTVVVFEDEEPEPQKVNKEKEVTESPQPQSAVNMHVVQAGETLFSISKKYGISVEQIKAWNNLTGNDISPGEKLIVGQTTTKQTSDSYGSDENNSVPPKIKNDTVFYVVQEGEDLYTVSKKNNTTIYKVISLNRMTSQKIYPGMKLIISLPESPEVKGTSAETATPKTTREGFDNPDALIIKKPAPKTTTETPAPKPKESTVTKVETQSEGSGNAIVHEVQPKEGLYSISKKYGVTIEQIKKWNNLTTDEIKIGQKLIVGYVGSPVVPTPQVTGQTEENFHTVSAGETLFSIAKKYGMSVETLKSINNLTDNNIKPGQKLRIK